MDLKLPRGRRQNILVFLTFASAVVGLGNLVLQVFLPNGSIAGGIAGVFVLSSLISLSWVTPLHTTVTLEGTAIHKRFLRTTTFELDSLVAIRVVGDANGGVVLQARDDDKNIHLALPLLRNDHVNGLHSLSSGAFEALGKTLDVIDLRDDTVVGVWPKRKDIARLNRIDVEGRRPVAALFHAQAEYMLNHADLTASPIAKLRFTSKLIATTMAAAYESPTQSDTPTSSATAI